MRGGGRGGRGGGIARGVYKLSILPHWFANNTRFWYVNALPGSTKEFILVDAEKGIRQPAFDHAKLAIALSRAAGQQYTADKLPFSDIEFVDDGKALRFSAAEKTWQCDLASYECTSTGASPAPEGGNAAVTPVAEPDEVAFELASERAPAELDNFASPADDESVLSPQQVTQQQQQQQRDQGTALGRGRGGRDGGGRGGGRGIGRGMFGRGPVPSPNGRWTAFVTNYNVFLRLAEGGEAVQLTEDGATNDYYASLSWSPDSKALVAWRIKPGDNGLVYLIQSSPPEGGRAIMTERPYAQAGDRYALCEVNVFNPVTHKQIKPQTDRWTDGNYGSSTPPGLRWERDQRHFSYEFPERGHQRWRLVEVDSQTGEVRNLIDETSKDFIWTAHPDTGWSTSLVRWLDQTEELLYVSEKDGWKHLYLVDIKEGVIKNQITKGEWVVRALDFIDETNRQVWIQGSGMNPAENPYDIHYYRVNFDGTGLTELTGGDGTHTVQYSPDYKYLVDTYSHIDVPPVHTLRRVSDGKLMCELERTDISELKATGWRPTESFVAKGRDGKTDIYGTIVWPRNLDTSKKYPILENIYAGPQMASVQHAFSAGGGGGRGGGPSYGDLGFVTVQIDGMGTPHRSHAFHAVCWQNLGRDNGFPDRILWHKAVAAKYPYYDITRVGIYGTSAGGQSAASAVIFHSDFYRAAVANSGCVDNRIDKASWNEQWMGYLAPDKIWKKTADNWYSQCSCIDNAAKLGGALLILAGEQDSNVPPESSLRLCDALMTGGKDFEMYYVPNANHGITVNGAYTQRKTREFFQRTLQGKEFPLDNSRASQN